MSRARRVSAPFRAARAFTLVEVLVVIGVLAVMASLVIPSLAGATAPLPRELGRLVEIDLRRARIEAIASVREMHVVLGRDRNCWWLQPAGAADPRRALPGSFRLLGAQGLGPFRDHRLEATLDGDPLRAGDNSMFVFSPEGVRDALPVELSLIEPLESAPVGRWRIAPERSTLLMIELNESDEDG